MVPFKLKYQMDQIGFSIDAGLINRLGVELVGRAETAVSELIKNAYDADATWVELDFINSNIEGGILQITDNGIGMTYDQLVNGFMKISSYDKIINPVSPIFGRSRAGKKGIGRFAAQRLGKRLILTTQTEDSNYAIQIIIEWEKYQIHTELGNILHPISEVPKQRPSGTTLMIEDLRETWTESAIKRVFRYTSELIQPNFLTDSGRDLKLSTDGGNSFEISFFQTINNERKVVADVDKQIFDFALAVIEGYVGEDKVGYLSTTSNRLNINEVIEINATNGERNLDTGTIPYKYLKNIRYKAYYFIYNRNDYYDSIPKMLLNQVLEFSRLNSGLKLYRNGFRVLPYGEPNNDWLKLDRRYSTPSGEISIFLGLLKS
jgi:hypothetical protein